jgi:hypothetical protein
LFYATVEVLEADAVIASRKIATAVGLPVVYGEVVDKIDKAHAQVIALE